MAVSINCCLKPSSPPTTTSLQSRTSPVTPWSAGLRRSCAAAAVACVVIVAGAAGGEKAAAALAGDLRGVEGRPAQAQARWSHRRRCPPWRANQLENIVPEDLPRPSARRRFNSVDAAAGRARGRVTEFWLPSDMGCFSL